MQQTRTPAGPEPLTPLPDQPHAPATAPLPSAGRCGGRGKVWGRNCPATGRCVSLTARRMRQTVLIEPAWLRLASSDSPALGLARQVAADILVGEDRGDHIDLNFGCRCPRSPGAAAARPHLPPVARRAIPGSDGQIRREPGRY